jgi:hypothetical protein
MAGRDPTGAEWAARRAVNEGGTAGALEARLRPSGMEVSCCLRVSRAGKPKKGNEQ